MDLCARCCEGTLVLLLVLDITELSTVIAKFKHLVKTIGNFNLSPSNHRDLPVPAAVFRLEKS